MNNQTVSVFAKISIAVIALAGLCICIFGYPFSISLGVVGVVPGGDIEITPVQNVAFYTQLIFYLIDSIPWFAVLVIAWQIADSIKNGRIFTSENVKRLFSAFVLIFSSSCVFLLGTAVFTVLEWNPFAIVYLFIGVVAVVLSFVMYVLAKYIDSARALKDENEAII